MFFVVLAVLAVTTDEAGAGAVFMLFALLGAYQFHRYKVKDVQQADFYDAFVRVKGKSLNEDIDYSRIERVELVRRFPMWEPRYRVQVTVKGQTGSLEIVAMNDRLKKDLFSWLRELVQQSTTPSGAAN